MRRFLTPPFALLAGMVLVLSACSGESPTSPSAPPGGGPGTCTTTITLASTSVTPLAGTAVIVRATAKKDGVAVPDGTSVLFTTDLGFFLESGLPTVSKVTVGGFADVTLASLSSGSSHVTASLDCGRGSLTVQFSPVPQQGPFVSTIFPNQGSCAGGDLVTINGGKFGSDPTAVRVTFGGNPASIQSVSATQIVVRTPARTLPNPQVPEQVDVVITIGAGSPLPDIVTVTKGFTYFCVNPNERMVVSSLSPNSGPPDGGTLVTILGQNFGNNAATTRVTFCNVSGSVVSVSASQIQVATPRHALANPNVPETCDVGVTIDLGLVSQQSAVLPQAFTYRASGTGGVCNTTPGLFISSIAPNSGAPEGGTSVTILGGGFGSSLATTRVEFGGVPGNVTSVSANSVTVTTPRHTLADPNVSETVEVRLFVDVGGPSQACASLANAFTFRSSGTGTTCNTAPGMFISSVSPDTGNLKGGDVVVITGAGFGTDLANTRVEFGGVAGQVTAVTANQITVVTPRYTLTNPNVSEPVEVKVIRDVGGPSQACATLARAFTFRAEPVIYSSSPRTGPNDASTRVTILGDGFQFPMQVFVQGGTCQGRVEASVVSIKLNEIVFLTPLAQNANACLAGGLVDIIVLNPESGKTANCPECFKYYTCPSLQGVTPAVAPYNATTTVIVTGNAFEEPVEATFVGPNGSVRLNVTSVSSSGIALQMPPINPIQLGANCKNVTGTIQLSFLNVSCPAVSTPFEYEVPQIAVNGATPTQLNQDGAPYGAGAGSAPATITVTGANFQDPMTVVLTKNGVPLAYTQVNNATVSSSGVLTFAAPPIRDADMNTVACSVAGQTIGNKLAPTSFGISVKNARTGCTGTLDNILVYNPSDPTCRSAPIVTTPTLAAAALCSSYGPVTLAAAGGTAPYSWTATGLPSGLTLNPLTGVISGTPALSANGQGVASQVVAVTVTVTDSASPAQSTQKIYQLLVTDAGAPFQITGQTTQTIAAAGGATSDFTAAPNAFPNITWSIDSINPAVPGITLSTTTGPTAHLNVAGSVPGGSYVVTLRATDAACGSFHHTATFAATVIKTPGSLAISSGAAPNGNLCQPYSFQFTAVGGTLPYTYSMSQVPAGLTLNPTTGVLSGTPQLSAAGAGTATIVTNFSLTVTDSSPTPQTVTLPGQSLTINDPNAPFTISGTASQTIPGGGGSTTPLTANPNPTPSLGAGQPFSPITWSIESVDPSPAPGTVTLTSTTGQSTSVTFSSTVPALPGGAQYTVIVRASDNSCGPFKHTNTFTLNISNTGKPAITSPDNLILPNAVLCQSYTATLTASGGQPPYSWNVNPPLPPGLALNVIGQGGANAQITGIPTLPATGEGGNQTYTLTFTVTDSAGTPQTGSRTYTLGVSDPDGPFVITGDGSQTFTNTVASDGSTLTSAVNKQPVVPPSWTPVFWSLTSAPAGFTIVGADGGNPTSGLTSHLHYDGTALAPGQYQVRVRAIDSPPCVSQSNPGVHHETEYTVIVTISAP